MATSQVTRHNNYIGGQWVEAGTGRTYTINNNFLIIIGYIGTCRN